jgi:SAM-dependent methyltransferase
MPSWIDYWNSDHPIYVNDRHKALHAAGLANDFRRHVKSSDASVLDFGCGEALYAEDVARFCGRLHLSDAAPAVREKLAERVRGRTNIVVQSAEETAAMPDRSFDLIVVNSVAQYLTTEQLAGFLPGWKRMLRPDGRLVLADIIPPGVSPITDAKALMSPTIGRSAASSASRRMRRRICWECSPAPGSAANACIRTSAITRRG